MQFAFVYMFLKVFFQIILQKVAYTQLLSVESISDRGHGTVNLLPEGEGEGRKLPCCVIGAAFGCLTVNYGHI